MSASMLDAALGWAREGFPVFPCRKKEPLTNHGFKDATVDAAQIRDWWATWPDAQIAIPTGAPTHVLSIDLDNPGAAAFLEQLEAQHSHLPRTRHIRTRPGRRQIHLSMPDGVRTKCATAFRGVEGFDIRADGGYCVVPPSIHHESGKPYKVIIDAPLAEAPAWLIEVLNERPSQASRNGNEAAGKKIPEGQRNATLTSLAGTMRRRGMSEDAIEAALLAENQRCSPPLPKTEVQRIAKSVSQYEPADVQEQTPFKRDVANAALFAQMHEGFLLYCADRRVWYAWDGKRFAENDLGEVMRCARATVGRRYEEALAETDDEQRKKRMTWALQSESRLEKMVGYASSETRLEVKRFDETFDLDPYLLNCANGILDLRTGELQPHNPAARMTLLTRVPYDPEARCPKFTQWLLDTCGGSVSLKDYLIRFIGYCLSGLTNEQAFWMLFGQSKTGKSTFIKILRHLLDEYATTLPEAAVVVTYHGNPEHALAQLANVRLATLVEIEKGKRYDEPKLKQITGQDWIGASKKYQNFFQFRSKAKLAIAVNQRPIVRETDDAFWNRCKPIPFLVVVPPEKRVKDLDVKLIEEEGPGILNLAASGFRELCAYGMNEPPEVKAATVEYRNQEDVVLQFIEEECEKAPEKKETAAMLFNAFVHWKERNDIRATWTKIAFGKELERLGYRSKKSGQHFWIGLHLVQRPAVQEELDVLDVS
jgi:putative DNA primase/helicase